MSAIIEQGACLTRPFFFNFSIQIHPSMVSGLPGPQPAPVQCLAGAGQSGKQGSATIQSQNMEADDAQESREKTWTVTLRTSCPGNNARGKN